MSFDDAFEKVVGIEGAYSNDPNDSGGETMYGITIQVARAYGYKDAMKDMPLSVAKVIYRKRYWEVLKLDDICKYSQELAHELFDTGVNCGVGLAATLLQRALNVLNRQQKDYADIAVDGSLGPVSLYALAGFVKTRGEKGLTVLLTMLNCLQGAHYVTLAEKREKDEQFVFGWYANRVVL